MPVVLQSGPYRLFFYSDEGNEPVHVHVERENKEAKFWLEPVKLASSGGFGAAEIRRIERIVSRNKQAIIQRWNEHFES
ncbi:DUF4160 domain-containing protein [Prosthecobacter vanneervenii]|uniref:DUF4160 domain-containing protein n=1 Tax=Prosthecobacter vanneervenii TaxID=48466 RepID=A0A7W8DMM3_9BACT|nr:DUF4160 domain-containing protein [Prosthecobacter vanneervenii]MBB5035508.1 hypothetical protein [Prosthecobacter vanneervenii]